MTAEVAGAKHRAQGRGLAGCALFFDATFFDRDGGLLLTQKGNFNATGRSCRRALTRIGRPGCAC
jgi:hypothetical protein